MMHAGSISPSSNKYLVSDPHDHRSLKHGDIVVLSESPGRHNLIIRLSDMSLHQLKDEYDQYVHLEPFKEARAAGINVIYSE